MMVLPALLVEFFCGSLMFSYWLGLAAGRDIRRVGDGNPGAFNLWNSAGFKFGILGVILDFMKGYIPLLLFLNSGVLAGWAVVPGSIAPILGHAFSPFVKFKGGKGIAVTFGVWSALTGFAASLAYAVILALFIIISRILTKGKPTSPEADAFMDVLGFCLLAVYLAACGYSICIIAAWMINLCLLVFTNRVKLKKFLSPRLNRPA